MNRADEQGVAAVELALLLPFLVTIVFGIAELGQALNTHKAVQEAVGEGVLYAAYNPADASGARDRVVDAVSWPALTLAEVTVTCPTAETVTVTVVHQHDLFTPIVGDLLGGQITMSVDATDDVLSTSTTCVADP